MVCCTSPRAITRITVPAMNRTFGPMREIRWNYFEKSGKFMAPESATVSIWKKGDDAANGLYGLSGMKSIPMLGLPRWCAKSRG